MAPPVSEGAERASRKGIGAPDRQRHGQGIARALRWREMLKNATYATIAEIGSTSPTAVSRRCPYAPTKVIE